MARIAGVSQATVSRVLHDHPSVTPETRSRVLSAMDASGYQPNLAARAMRTRRTGTVGLVIDDVTNPFYPELIQTISGELARHDLRMVLWDSASPGESAALEAIGQSTVDGLIFTTATAASRPLHEAIRRGSPVVLVNRVVEDLACDQIDGDNHRQAAGVARYFARAGRRRVALVGGPKQASTARDRMAGFAQGCRDHDLILAAGHTVDGGFSFDGGRVAAARILENGARGGPAAIFCTNDMSALGVLDELGRRGVAVPEDVWVVGYDDIAMTRWSAFDLTTVHQPSTRLAAAGVELLVRRLAEPAAAPVRRQLPGRLVVRGSTAHVPEDRADE